MPRRIEIELTSARDDGTWTWRAAGAKQPRGVIEGALVPEGVKVGDIVRADAEVELDGTTISALHVGAARVRKEPERIEIVGTGRRGDDELVTTSLLPKGKGDRGDRRERRDRGDRPDRPDRPGGREKRDGPGRGGEGRGDGRRGPRPADGQKPDSTAEKPTSRPRRDRPDGDRRPRHPAPPPMPERPKPKRLRPGHVHRKAVLAELKPEQQLIADEVLKGGIPAVRQAIETENEKRAAAGESPINAPELLDLAEKLLPRLQTAVWRDRADAALADADQLDLRDLRSVVVAGDAAARDDDTRALAAQLRERLSQRIESEQAAWLEDLNAALDAGRVVRALRVSSRPPKAGTILAPELRARLTEAASSALTADVVADRWAAVLDAAAFSPVRTEIAPAAPPEAPGEELLAAVRKYASRVPKVAAAFGVEVPSTPPPRGTRPPRPPGSPSRPSGPRGAKPIPPPPRPIPPPPTQPTEAEAE